MRQFVYKILLLGGVLMAASCSNSEDQFNDVSFEEYQATHNILYVKNYGKQEINMNTVESTPVYSIHVLKAGIDTSLPAHMKLSVISQKELDDTYGLLDKMNYKIIPTNMYSKFASEVDLQPQEASKKIDITFKSDLIHELIEENEDVQYVLPIRLSSEQDSVDVLKNDVMLVLNVKKPQILFKNKEVKSTMVYKQLEVDVEANLQNIQSKWDFTCQLSDGENENAQLVENYNKTYNTNYLPLPPSAYTMPELTFKKGKINANLKMNISRTPLKSDKNYLLPLKMKQTSLDGFEVDENACFLIVENPKYTLKDCDRSKWKVVFCNSDHKNTPGGGGGDGGGAGMLFDNNINTYWHCNYGGPNDDNQFPQLFEGSRELPHTIVVDMKEPIIIHSFGWAQRQYSDYQDPKKIQYYVSDDTEFQLGGKENYSDPHMNNWTYLMEGSYEKANGVQWKTLPNENLDKLSKGHLLKIKVTESNRPNLSNGGELYVKQVVAIDGEPI